MALMDFLAQLGGGNTPFGNQVLPNVMQPTMGGFAGGTFGLDGKPVKQPFLAALGQDEMVATPPNMMEQIRAAQAQPELRDPFAGQAAQAPAAPKQFSGLRDTLGQIGDYLLQANDMQPIYAPRKAEYQRREASAALSQYLGQMDPTIGGIAQYDPQSAIELLKMKSKQQGQDPTALMQNMEYLRRLNPGMTDAQLAEVAQYAIAAPRMYGSPETGFTPDPNYPFTRAQPEGGDLQEGATATNPTTGEKIVFRNGAWVPMGGASGNAGGGF